MNRIVKVLAILVFISTNAQQGTTWKGYFSYSSITDIAQSNSKIYASTSNAYFKRDIATNEIAKVSTIEGLSGQTITQIFHSKTSNKTFVGHIDGLVVVVNDLDGTVFNLVDIVNKPSIPPNMKKINHFMEYGGKIYIATDFGISIYNLTTSEFGDSYYIGPGGGNIPILQTTVFNNEIYAVASGYGILKANVASTNLIDFAQWTLVAPGDWIAVETIGNQAIAVKSDSGLYKFVGNTTVLQSFLSQHAVDVRSVDNYLIITSPNYVAVYDEQLVRLQQISGIPNFSVTFTCASIINSNLYLGTKDNGVFKTTVSNSTVFDNITPNGPDRNRVFGINSYSKGFWVVYGDYNGGYNPYPLDSYGISKYDFQTSSFSSIPYQDLFNAKSIVRPLVNPKNENQVYFGSSYSGVLKVENDLPALIYNRSNSSLLTIPGQPFDDIRVSALAFDNEGTLWATNSIVSTGLHAMNSSGQWQAHPISCMGNAQNSSSYSRMTVDKNGTKWFATNLSGVIGYNEKFNKCIQITNGQGDGNLPSRDARAVAVDKKNKLWIGTNLGLRVLPSVDSFLSQTDLETNSIIIMEDNLAQELLFSQFISDIVVDGADNKWIGTFGSGVFYISADGQKTYHIFTKENSPLPSNTIIDIDINDITGEVFFATDGGLVSYNGIPTKGRENFENVIVYPNPVRPEYKGNVVITGLMDKANVKITDIEGNLVHEAISKGGTIEWDTRVFGKNKVASGVYIAFMSSDDGEETTTKKIMIVR